MKQPSLNIERQMKQVTMFNVRGLEHREFPQLSLHQSSLVYLWFICEVQDFLQTIVLGEVI